MEASRRELHPQLDEIKTTLGELGLTAPKFTGHWLFFADILHGYDELKAMT
jgi:hypothetical protein